VRRTSQPHAAPGQREAGALRRPGGDRRRGGDV